MLYYIILTELYLFFHGTDERRICHTPDTCLTDGGELLMHYKSVGRVREGVDTSHYSGTKWLTNIPIIDSIVLAELLLQSYYREQSP